MSGFDISLVLKIAWNFYCFVPFIIKISIIIYVLDLLVMTSAILSFFFYRRPSWGSDDVHTDHLHNHWDSWTPFLGCPQGYPGTVSLFILFLSPSPIAIIRNLISFYCYIQICAFVYKGLAHRTAVSPNMNAQAYLHSHCHSQSNPEALLDCHPPPKKHVLHI